MLTRQPTGVSKNREVKILFLHLIRKTKDYYANLYALKIKISSTVTSDLPEITVEITLCFKMQNPEKKKHRVKMTYDFWRDAKKEFHKRLAQLFTQLKGGRKK